MKKLLTLLPLFLTCLFANAQTGYVLNSLSLPSTTVLTSCDTTVSVSYSAQTPATNSGTNPATLPFVLGGANFVPSQYQFNISWGDGSSNTANGGTSTSGTIIPINPPFTHTYPGPGTYMIITYVMNMANQTYAVDTVNFTVGYCNLPVYTMVQVDCDNNGTVDSTLNNVGIPLVLTGSGQVYNGTTMNNYYNFLGIQPGYYNLSINSAWLTSNNYTIGSIQGPTFLTPGVGATTILITLNCANGGGTTTPMCVGGQVYCDQDSNGVYSTGDIAIANAPISVNYGTGNTTVYTNSQGYYSTSYNGTVNGTSIISLNSNWLSNNGYTASNLIDSVLNVPCQSGLPPALASFPINCGQTQGTSNCFSGYVFCDANNNGIMDNGELPLTFAPVTLYTQPSTGNINSVIVYTDSNGYFIYCGSISTNNYVIATISQQWLLYSGYTSNSSVITLVGNNTGTTIVGMLPVNCGGTTVTCADMWTTVTPWIGYYQNTTAYVKISWGNYGPNAPGPYTLTFTFPAGVTVNTSTINTPGYTISGNTITWNLNSNLNSFSNLDIITFNVPSGIASGTQHFFTSTIAPTGNTTDCYTTNNNGSLLQIVGNSYDPNDKNVEKTSNYMASPYAVEEIDVNTDDVLTYTIRFQNTGNAPAQNVYIIDTLDSELDWSSFTAVQNSHPMQVVDLGNGIRRFEFNNIWLSDSTTNEAASHGHLVYRIKENPGNVIGSEITNTAHIYFDWNAPIVTNTTYNVNTYLETIDEVGFNSSVFPNPTNSMVTVQVPGNFEFQLLDLQGRNLISGKAESYLDLNLSSYSSGNYLLLLNKNDILKTVKIIKQ